MIFKRFEWKDGSKSSLDAQVVGERLEAIAQKHGSVTPELVLREARPLRSPLHDAFEWDDAVAAEHYRAEQARYLIRSIVVTVEQSGKEFEAVRAFISIGNDEGGREYVSLSKAMSDEDLRQQIIQRALFELDQWRLRYEQYRELSALVKTISKFSKLKSA